jgi:hypothetical protein
VSGGGSISRSVFLVRITVLGYTNAEVLAEMPTEALVEELKRRGALVRAGSLSTSWVCLNCGDDHGGAGCDDPNFPGIDLWRFEGVGDE